MCKHSKFDLVVEDDSFMLSCCGKQVRQVEGPRVRVYDNGFISEKIGGTENGFDNRESLSWMRDIVPGRLA